MTDTDDLDFDDEIGTATGSNYARQEDLDGCLLLIRPYEQGTRASKTNAGQEYTWVEGDVVVLATPADGWPTEHFDAEKPGLVIEAFQFTGQNVVGQLVQKMRRGKKVLGVLEQGAASRGRNAPWLLNPPTEEQIAFARKYVTEAAKRAEKADAFA